MLIKRQEMGELGTHTQRPSSPKIATENIFGEQEGLEGAALVSEWWSAW